ncbi:translation initiation factor IF-2, partial [Campylobacter fetus]
AKAAGVPIIIAINKMDKESANPDLVKTGLADLDILPTEWGGSYEFVPISAKTGMGIEDLLEIVLLQAEILELKANPSREAKATIIESSLQKGRGPVATAIVENGTLRVGDTIVAGVAYGKVRALQDDKGNSLKSIKPGECGVIIGLSEVPDAGETLISVKTDKEAREYAQKKYDYLRQKELSKSTKVTIDELSARIAEGELKSLPLIVKADVQGSLEAIKASLEKLKNDEIKVDIIHSGVGGITQSDITLASASANCVILGFNIRPTGDVKEKAKERSVEIKTYNVIYNLIDDVKALLSGLMSPIISEEELGQAVIRQVINVPKIGQIAGCMVTDGSINRGAKIRVIRDGVVVFEGNVSSLKRFKDDVKEVAKGYECGVGIEGYNDMREGDYIESYKEVESKVEL